MEYRLKYEDSYIDLLSDIIKELLHEKKMQKLQTFGYSLEMANAQTSEISSVLMGGNNQGEVGVKCNFINLNK